MTRTHSKTKRTAFLVAAGLAATTAIAGCSSSSDGGEGDGADGSGPVTISYGVWDDTQAKVMEQIADKFHETHPDITVKVQVTPWDQYWTKLKTAATGGAAPDVFWMNESNFATYASGGVLANLSDKLDGSEIDMSNYVDIQTEAYTFDGSVYGIPKDIDSIGLWYNKALFAEAGIAEPTGDWTWDDMVAAAQKLTDPSKGQYGIVAQSAPQQSYYSTIPQTGGQVISDDLTSSGYGTPEAIKGVQVWVDLVNKYQVSPTLQQMTDTDADTWFTSGKAAMIFEGSWAAAEFKEIPYAAENANVAPMPKLDQPGGVSNGLGNVMSAKSEQPEAAWEFLQYLGSKEAATAQAEAGIVIPAYKGTTDGWVNAFPEFNLQVFVDALESSTKYPSSMNSAAWQDPIELEFNKAWGGEQTAEQAAANATKIMNDALAAEK